MTPPRTDSPRVSTELLPLPRNAPSTLKGTLITEAQLRERIQQLGQQLNQDYQNEGLVVVGILSGTVLFLADLLRELTGPVQVDFVGASSYRDGTTSGELEINRSTKSNLMGRRVLIVDDILDAGHTLTRVQQLLAQQGPKELRSCVLLEKTTRRAVAIEADYVGFRIPDYFVVGYGLDYAECYRNLPYVGVLDDSLLSD